MAIAVGRPKIDAKMLELLEISIQSKKQQKLNPLFRNILAGLLIYFIIVSLLTVLALYFPLNRILSAKAELMAVELEGINKIPDIKSTIKSIEEKLTKLTTENIEARLATIEKAIKSGEIKKDEIKSLMEIQMI